MELINMPVETLAAGADMQLSLMQIKKISVVW